MVNFDQKFSELVERIAIVLPLQIVFDIGLTKQISNFFKVDYAMFQEL